MAGHNKWSKVKHIKAKVDAAKGKIFSKIAREIVVAAKRGGGDPAMNAALRLSVQKAKEANMPRDNIERAIAKGVGGGDDTNMEEVLYEAYGPNGVAILIETLTDNKNRTFPNVREIINKAGGSMANSGAVSYLFEKKGVILFEPGSEEEKVVTIATDNGAEDISLQEDGSIEVITLPSDLENIRSAFESNALAFIRSGLEMLPTTQVMLEKEDARKILKLIDSLEEDDDVQNVFANYDVSDDVMAELVGE